MHHFHFRVVTLELTSTFSRERTGMTDRSRVRFVNLKFVDVTVYKLVDEPRAGYSLAIF